MNDDPVLRAYRRLLAAYPRAFREAFGEDMVQVLADQLRDSPAAQRGRVLAGALRDLLATAPVERVEALRPRPALAAAGAGATVPPGPVVRRSPVPLPTRREFLRRSFALTAAGIAASAGAASLAYLWPNSRGMFGALVEIGTVADVTAAIRAGGGTWAVPSARSYLVAYDPADDPEGMYADITAGAPFMALYQRCVHLGCRVPWCTASTRFECPCHKSRYNRWGEFQDGPAPRGLDRFAVAVDKGRVVVDTRTIVTGPPRTVTALQEGPTGPSCVVGV